MDSTIDVEAGRDRTRPRREVQTRPESTPALNRGADRVGASGRVAAWVTQSIDLRRPDEDHGLRNAAVAVAAAGSFGALNGAAGWHFYPRDSYLGSFVLVDAIGTLVLTPLIVGIFLALPDLTRRLIRRLREDGIIEMPPAGLDAAAPAFDPLRSRVPAAFAAALACLYLGFALRFEDRDLSLPMGLLVVAILVFRAALVYLAVVALLHLVIVARVVGRLLQGPVHVQPLHPDRCGGLWIVGRLFSLTLNIAAVLGGVALCIVLALHGAPVVLARRPELYLLAAFYLGLLPSAFLNLLWRPHQLLETARGAALKPVARVFDAAIEVTTPSATDGADRLAAKTESLSQIARQFQMMDDIWPVWPLRMRRLRAVIVTAVLPAAIPLVTAVAIPLLTKG